MGPRSRLERFPPQAGLELGTASRLALNLPSYRSSEKKGNTCMSKINSLVLRGYFEIPVFEISRVDYID